MSRHVQGMGGSFFASLQHRIKAGGQQATAQAQGQRTNQVAAMFDRWARAFDQGTADLHYMQQVYRDAASAIAEGLLGDLSSESLGADEKLRKKVEQCSARLDEYHAMRARLESKMATVANGNLPISSNLAPAGSDLRQLLVSAGISDGDIDTWQASFGKHWSGTSSMRAIFGSQKAAPHLDPNKVTPGVYQAGLQRLPASTLSVWWARSVPGSRGIGSVPEHLWSVQRIMDPRSSLGLGLNQNRPSSLIINSKWSTAIQEYVIGLFPRFPLNFMMEVRKALGLPPAAGLDELKGMPITVVRPWSRFMAAATRYTFTLQTYLILLAFDLADLAGGRIKNVRNLQERLPTSSGGRVNVAATRNSLDKQAAVERRARDDWKAVTGLASGVCNPVKGCPKKKTDWTDIGVGALAVVGGFIVEAVSLGTATPIAGALILGGASLLAAGGYNTVASYLNDGKKRSPCEWGWILRTAAAAQVITKLDEILKTARRNLPPPPPPPPPQKETAKSKWPWIVGGVVFTGLLGFVALGGKRRS